MGNALSLLCAVQCAKCRRTMAMNETQSLSSGCLYACNLGRGELRRDNGRKGKLTQQCFLTAVSLGTAMAGTLLGRREY